MSVFQPQGALLSVGGAILYTVGGMNPQRISGASEGRVVGHPVPAGMDYQLTGQGQRSVTIEARTYPHVMGGLDSLAILKTHHEMQSVVPYIRLAANYLALASGDVVIQTLEADEERLHPHDGVGRIVDVTIGLIMMPSTSVLGFQ